MKIYVASSWRNEKRQQETVRTLRESGYEVYDFRNPEPGDSGFGWRQCVDTPQPWSAETMREVLKHPRAQEGFRRDMAALTGADATVLVLPCGRSAHLELGWATGAGRRTIVLLDDLISEPELMYLACSKICVNLVEVIQELASFQPGRSPLEVDALANVDWVQPRRGQLEDVIIETSGPRTRPSVTVRDRRHRHQAVELHFTRDSAIALAHHLLTVTEA